MDRNWVVVANDAAARIFTLAPPPARLNNRNSAGHQNDRMASYSLKEIESLQHPEGRTKAQDFDADRPGRAFQTAGSMRHGMERQVDPKRQAIISFAKRVADRLESARRQGALQRLVLVAAPEFLGLLRTNLSAELGRITAAEFSLDLAQMKAHEIRAHLPDDLFIGSPPSR